MEIRLRLRRIIRSDPVDHVVHLKDLALNTATYQATLAGEPMDLTYMEYELLRFFVEHQGRVWSRQQLLAKVWGYDYFGGASTVDVHVRRLRSKLGEERASPGSPPSGRWATDSGEAAARLSRGRSRSPRPGSSALRRGSSRCAHSTPLGSDASQVSRSLGDRLSNDSNVMTSPSM